MGKKKRKEEGEKKRRKITFFTKVDLTTALIGFCGSFAVAEDHKKDPCFW